MKSVSKLFTRLPAIKRNENKVIFTIAVAWTFIDFLQFLYRKTINTLPAKYSAPEVNIVKEILLRELNVFLISLIIGYFLVSVLKNYLPNSSLGFNIIMKTAILVLAAFFMNFFIYVTYETLIAGKSLSVGIEKFIHNMFYTKWLLVKMPEWVLLFILTLLALEINEKYSRGVFLNIMLGKYLQPIEEERIILFLDLTDSTPIAEKLGHKEYFKFIRDFIFFVSAGIIQNDGRIYQYVGDEIVVWWPASKENAKKAIESLISTRKELNKAGENFRRKYDTIPDYKAGIHTGLVTVGQVGIEKKDVVMSGNTINTAARIRSACTDLNKKYLASGAMIDLIGLAKWQSESMGEIELKGKNDLMELFALKI